MHNQAQSLQYLLNQKHMAIQPRPQATISLSFPIGFAHCEREASPTILKALRSSAF
jgi:hypothetical protein